MSFARDLLPSSSACLPPSCLAELAPSFAWLLPSFDSTLVAIWFWVTVALVPIWLRRHLDLRRGRREPMLRPDEPGPADGELPTVSFLLAARDEEANIGRCLESLLRQDYPRLQIIVANDRSRDRTGAILEEFAARDPRVTVVHVTRVREGWFGKNNAMQDAVQHATGEWLCFSDADCCYDSPSLIRSAVRFALREGADFLSVLPTLEARTFWERVVQPVAGAIMVYWFPPQRVNSPHHPHAYANGAFMLVSRSAYERIGGHEPVRATLNEDMHMARRIKEAGLRLRVIRGGGMYRVRMYTGFPQIWRGWSRIFYGCLQTPARLAASIVMLSVFSASPTITLLLSPLAGSGGPWLAGAGLAAYLSQQSVLWGFYHATGNGRAWALTYPLGATVCMGMTVNSLRRLAGVQTTWRGSRYQGGGAIKT